MHVCAGPRLWVLVVLLTASASFVSASDAGDRAAVESAAQAWIDAFNRNDLDALMALATPDVILLTPDDSTPVAGGAAARQALRRATATAGRVISLTKEIVVNGDVAWRVSAVEHELPPGRSFRRGSSLEIWKRVGDAWRVHRISATYVAPPDLRPRRPDEPVLNSPRD